MMKMARLTFLLTLAVLRAGPLSLSAADASGGPASEAAGVPYQVETVKFDWVDQKRERKGPVKIYYPKEGKGPFPVIIFSHGLGGSRDGYEYLGRYWAGHGYVSVHVQHLGSDSAVWQGVAADEVKQALEKAIIDPQNIRNRPLDVTFAIDQVTKLNQNDAIFKGRLDLEHIGMAGHSFGAFTTLAIAGQVFPNRLGDPLSWADSRVKAAIAMSPSAPRNKNQLDESFSNIKIPCFHMTGTLDDSPVGNTKAADRRVPFDHMHGADEFLLTFTGGDHMVFSGRLAGEAAREKDSLFQNLVCLGSTAFWDAYLKDDAKAKEWLIGGGFESALKDDGKFEQKMFSDAVKSKN
jgi:predicted dienelactone hydrolase